MSKKKLLEFGLKEADAFQKNFKIIFDRLVRGYKSIMGKEPEGLDLLKVKMEAREKALNTTKVVNQKGLTLDPDKPITGGTQEGIPTIKTKFDEELDEFNLSKDDPMGDLEKIVKGEGDTGLPKKIMTTRGLGDLFPRQIKKSVEKAKKAKDEFNLSKDDPMGDLEKIVKGEGETGLPKKEIPRDVKETFEEELGVKLYGDETFDELMIIKNTGKHPRDMADGGIIGTAKNIIGSGLDKGSDIGRFILSAASGIPGLGFVVGGLQNLQQKTFSNLPIGDQLFITEQGDLTDGNKDKYGYNIRSGFGNYANLVAKRAKIAEDRRQKGLQQRAIDEYYTNLEKERRAAEAEAQRRAEILTSQMATANRAAGTGGYQSSFGGDSGFMSGSGTAAEMGSFADGGLATMFVEKR